MSVLGGDFSSYSDSGPRIMGTRQQIASVAAGGGSGEKWKNHRTISQNENTINLCA